MSLNNTKNEAMKKIRDEVFGGENLPLYKNRIENGNFPVIGEGSYNADIVFIGEAPGRNEAKTGRPFCGVAGKILDELLESAGIKREDVYITNIVKDRPPSNRDPLPEEIKAYSPFLDRQIEIIQPKIIATLGRYSMQYIMNKFGLGDKLGTIGQLHGQSFVADIKGRKIKIVVLYHPAATIYNQNLKDTLKKDFKVFSL